MSWLVKKAFIFIIKGRIGFGTQFIHYSMTKDLTVESTKTNINTIFGLQSYGVLEIISNHRLHHKNVVLYYYKRK